MSSKAKIIYIGSSGPLSAIPLQALLACGYGVCAIACEADDTPAVQHQSILVLGENTGSIATLARLHNIPLIDLSGSWSQRVDEIASYSPDVILVSCFARRLPETILSIPSIGCFNLHPSLLPAYRGPVPLFWQFRAGVEAFGVTLHRMSSQLDAGNIVAQTTLAMPDGISGQGASTLLAQAGGRLLLQTFRNGAETELIGSPQDERYASYQGLPSPCDYAVNVNWSARRLYNFICATREPGVHYSCRIDSRVYRLLDVESWRQTGDSEFVISGDTITVPCSPGFVTARFQAC